MRHCIDSLLPGGDDVEIIIINDGSGDRTAKIAETYQRTYPGTLLSGLIIATPPEEVEVNQFSGGEVCSYIIPRQILWKEGLFLSFAISGGRKRLSPQGFCISTIVPI
jgi:glycosyltransferase involved in cell wall biosynthesis